MAAVVTPGNMIGMALASSSQQSLLSTIPPIPGLHQPYRSRPKRCLISCHSSSERDGNIDPSSSTSGVDGNAKLGMVTLAKLGTVTLAAGVLTLGSVNDALAAKSGGRVGGQAFRSAAPRGSSPGTNRSRTNIFINPPVAPPLFGGYGYGSPFYGGWGWSPFSFFAPGPSVAVGVGGGFDLFVVLFVAGAVAAVVRRFTVPRDDEDEY